MSPDPTAAGRPRARALRYLSTALIVVASAGVALYAAECVLELLAMRARPGLNRNAFAAARRAGRPFDVRSKSDVVRALESAGVRAYPAPVAQFFLGTADAGVPLRVVVAGRPVLPLSGVANATTVLCNESGRFVVYDADERGFRNPPGSWRPGAVALAAVGDSFTAGHCVADDSAFVGRLRARVPATLALGTAGAGPLFELAMVREYLTAVRPRTVLWCYYENDLADLGNEQRNATLARYFGDPGFRQQLGEHQPEIDRQLAAFFDAAIRHEAAAREEERRRQRALRSYLSLRLVREALRRARTRRAPARPGDIALLLRVLGEARATVASWGGELYFVFLPSWVRYAGRPSDDVPRSALAARDSILRGLAAMTIPVIDADAALRAHGAPTALFAYPAAGAHYTAEGHGIVAEAIARRLGLPPRSAP